MAQAQATTIETTETIVKKSPGVTLTLTLEEAQVLSDIFLCVGGSPTESRRGLVNGIADELRKVEGVRPRYSNHFFSEKNNAIYFKTGC